MTKKTLAIASLSALLTILSSPVVRAEEKAPAEHKKADHPETDIEKSMKGMNKALKQLRGQITDAAQNASSVELVGQIKAGATEARKHVPLKAGTLPEAERAGFTESYQQGLDKLIETLTQLETVLKAGDNVQAAALVAEIGKLRKAGHSKFELEH